MLNSKYEFSKKKSGKKKIFSCKPKTQNSCQIKISKISSMSYFQIHTSIPQDGPTCIHKASKLQISPPPLPSRVLACASPSHKEFHPKCKIILPFCMLHATCFDSHFRFQTNLHSRSLVAYSGLKVTHLACPAPCPPSFKPSIVESHAPSMPHFLLMFKLPNVVFSLATRCQRIQSHVVPSQPHVVPLPISYMHT